MYFDSIQKLPMKRALATAVAAGALLAGCGGSSGTHTAKQNAATAGSTQTVTTIQKKAHKHTSSLPTKTSHHKFKGCPPVCGY
jgi:hypothetical protein